MNLENEIEQLQALYTEANQERVVLEARLRRITDAPRNWAEYFLALIMALAVVIALPIAVWYVIIVGLAR